MSWVDQALGIWGSGFLVPRRTALAGFSDPVDVNDFLTEYEPEYDWCIPGVLEKGDRVIVTGNEGKGKSTLLRQIGIKAAMGVHPFELNYEQPPQKVWLVDLENHRGHLRREVNKIKRTLPIDPEFLMISSWPQGLDLTQHADQQEVTKCLTELKPDLVIIGPMYKMMPKLEQEEYSSLLARQLDRWRVDFKCTFIIESHQPHQTVVDGSLYRSERPYGSSLWLRWPEFGLCLEDSGTLRHWRGARDEREWPKKLKRGEMWPWEVDELAGFCEVCGVALTGSQQRYCSDEHANAGRQRTYRAKKRTGVS